MNYLKLAEMDLCRIGLGTSCARGLAVKPGLPGTLLVEEAEAEVEDSIACDERLLVQVLSGLPSNWAKHFSAGEFESAEDKAHDALWNVISGVAEARESGSFYVAVDASTTLYFRRRADGSFHASSGEEYDPMQYGTALFQTAEEALEAEQEPQAAS